MTTQATETHQESLSGEITAIVYQAQDSGYCVLKIHTFQNQDHTVTGHIANPQLGQPIQARGIWIENQYGRQFKANHISLSQPKTQASIIHYLSSGLIKGIGKQLATAMVNHFGLETLNIIEHQPQRLTELDGIGKKRVEVIKASFSSQKNLSELMMFCQNHGIGTQRAIKIYKRYGDSAIGFIQEDPYRLYRDISGIGFKIADQIALKSGIEPHAAIRIENSIIFLLKEAASSGHSHAQKEALCIDASKLLSLNQDHVSQALEALNHHDQIIYTLIDQTPVYYLKSIYHAERQVASRIHTLVTTLGHLPPISQVRQQVSQLEDFLGYRLSVNQERSLDLIFSNKVNILTGGPGVGKTTLIQSVVRILKKNHKIIKLCAPTGRAAKRLQESTGHPAQTIHRTLGIDPVTKQFSHNRQNPLKIEYCIIDECSMLDIILTEKVLNALPDSCGLLLVGDIDQLPSVGPGKILKDLIQSQRIPVIELTEIFRQGQTSCIIEYAHRVRVGKMPCFRVDDQALLDCYGLFYHDTTDIIQIMQQLIKERIPKKFNINPKEDIQVLCPMHKGPLGTGELNQQLQYWLNPDSSTHQSVKTSYGQKLCLGDKVMQTRNNYDKDIFNGDLGFVTRIDHDNQHLIVSYEGRAVQYYFDECDEIQLAYAMSIHKSQGSEFPVVILPIYQGHYLMLERTLLYTAMTRAKKLLIVVGQKKALHMAIQNHSSHERLGFLHGYLEQCFAQI